MTEYCTCTLIVLSGFRPRKGLPVNKPTCGHKQREREREARPLFHYQFFMIR